MNELVVEFVSNAAKRAGYVIKRHKSRDVRELFVINESDHSVIVVTAGRSDDWVRVIGTDARMNMGLIELCVANPRFEDKFIKVLELGFSFQYAHAALPFGMEAL